MSSNVDHAPNLSAKAESFVQAFAIQHRFLFAQALRLTRNIHDAEDLVQDTFVSGFRAAENYEERGQFAAWITRVLKNSFINRYRRKLKGVEVLIQFGHMQPTALHAGEELAKDRHASVATRGLKIEQLRDPDFLLSKIADSLDDQVLAAIYELPDEQQIIILLDHFDYSYGEIANILQIPQGTVMSRLCRARKAARKNLGDYAEQEFQISYENPRAKASEQGRPLTP